MDVVVLTDDEFPQAYIVVDDVTVIPTPMGSSPRCFFETRPDLRGELVPLAELYEISSCEKR